MDRNDIPQDPCPKVLHRVCPKWFLSLWYAGRKPCTYLASRLALCLKGPKRASTWASSPNGTIGCIQNNFWAYGTSSANHAPILHQRQHYLQIERREIPYDPCHQGAPSDACKMISEPMLRSTQTEHLSCVKISTISKRTKMSFHLSYLPSGTIGCIQNDLRACGTSSANQAPILHRH